MLSNFPKIESPFVRKNFKAKDINALQIFLKHHRMRPSYDGILYLATPEIASGYEWVFEDKSTVASEKLDGTNIKVKISNGRLEIIQNRLNPPIDPLSLRMTGSDYTLVKGVFETLHNGRNSFPDGEFAGELIGPKIQDNFYSLSINEWIPFDKAQNSLIYKSWHNFPKNYESFNIWFVQHLRSLFYSKRHKVKIEDAIFAEGVIFVNQNRRNNKEVWMAKLRRNMFKDFYAGIEFEE